MPNMDMTKLQGAIPGESLTKPPGASPWEKAPQFIHLDDALEYFWSKLNNPDKAVELYAMLKSQIPVESIARTILLTAFTKGIINVDIALQALPTVVKQIAAIGKFMGVNNMIIKNPDRKKDQKLASLGQLMAETKQDMQKIPEQQPQPIFKGLGI